MERDLLLSLSSSAQWAVFLGVVGIIYGRLERKPKLVVAAQILLALLGAYAVFVCTSGWVVVPPFNVGDKLPAEAMLLNFFMGLVALGVLALVALLLGNKRPKLALWLNVLLAVVGIVLFFMVYNLMKIPV